MSDILSIHNPAANYLQALSGGSRNAQRSALDIVARTISPGSNWQTYPWEKFTREKMLQLRSHFADTKSPGTANRLLSAVKQVCREAWQLHLMPLDELHRILAVKRIPGSRLSAGRRVPISEIKTLIDVAEKRGGRMGARDVALIHVLFFGGFRRAEVASMRTNFVRIEDRRVIVRVVGKGNKERDVPLPRTSTKPIRRWLSMVGSEVLFPSQRGVEMTPANLGIIVKKLAQRASVGHFSPHDGRRTFITNLFEVEADVSAIQALAGHANVATTLIYDLRPERGKARAVDKLAALCDGQTKPRSSQ